MLDTEGAENLLYTYAAETFPDMPRSEKGKAVQYLIAIDSAIKSIRGALKIPCASAALRALAKEMEREGVVNA